MEYRRLGSSGLRASVLGLGGWLSFGRKIETAESLREMLRLARDRGVNMFDVADNYARGEAEELLGQALGSFTRRHLVIASKVFFPMSDDPNDRGLSRKHIFESIVSTLRRLRSDYLDIYYCHRFDETTPVAETARAMSDLVTQGKVLYWGTSQWPAEELHRVIALCKTHGWHAPIVEQSEYSLLRRTRVDGETRPALRSLGLGLTAWSPLASGVLTGKYQHDVPTGSRFETEHALRKNLLSDVALEKVRVLIELAGELSCSPAQLAIAWVLSQPGVSCVLMGASNVDQLEENLGAVDVDIPGAVRRALEETF